ncbi:hypothetical protein Barb6_02665 [Bacteroidales bacterium Barb6]|nr:hypothetical protein Barb6_02665 [Bacteroidales bacterium Barb6]
MLFQGSSNTGNISVIINALSKWHAKYPSLAMPFFYEKICIFLRCRCLPFLPSSIFAVLNSCNRGLITRKDKAKEIDIMFEINNATPIAALTVGQFTELIMRTRLQEKKPSQNRLLSERVNMLRTHRVQHQYH